MYGQIFVLLFYTLQEIHRISSLFLFQDILEQKFVINAQREPSLSSFVLLFYTLQEIHRISSLFLFQDILKQNFVINAQREPSLTISFQPTKTLLGIPTNIPDIQKSWSQRGPKNLISFSDLYGRHYVKVPQGNACFFDQFLIDLHLLGSYGRCLEKFWNNNEITHKMLYLKYLYWIPNTFKLHFIERA